MEGGTIGQPQCPANFLHELYIILHNVDKSDLGAELGEAYAADAETTADVEHFLTRHEFFVELVVPAADLISRAGDVALPNLQPIAGNISIVLLQKFCRASP